MYDGVTLPRIVVELALAVNPSNDPNATPYLTLGNPATPLGTGTLGSSEIWTDVTDYVDSISARMGRERELDSTEPGACVLVFDNTSGDFDPTNTTSPFYATTDSNIRPMLAVRVRAVLNGTEYQIFRGYATDYSFDFGSHPTATFECHDALFLLAQADVEPPTYTNIIGPRNPDFDNAADYGTVAGPDSDGWYTCTPGPYGNVSHYDCPSMVAGTTYMLAVEIQNADLGDFDMRGFIGDAAVLTTSLIPTGQSAWFYAVATANGTDNYAEFDGVDQTYKFRNPMVIEAITPGDEINRMLDVVGLPASLRSVATGDVWMPLQLETVNALAYAQAVALMDNGFFFGGPDGSAVFATAGSIATAPRSTTSQLTFSDEFTREADYRTGLIPNPIVETDATGWHPWSTLGLATGARQTGQTGWAYGIDTSYRVTWSGHDDSESSGLYLDSIPGIVPNEPYASIIQVRCSKAQRLGLTFEWYDSTGTFIRFDWQTVDVFAPNEVVTLTGNDIAPANAASAYVGVYTQAGAGYVPWESGDWLEATLAHAEQESVTLAYSSSIDFSELAVEYSTDSIANNIDVKRVNGWAWQNANDPESINRYGRKALKNSTVSLDALTLALDSDALVFAGLIRDRFKDPQLRVTEISVLVNAQPGVVALVMALQALDRITVQRRYASRNAVVPDFTRELLIQGVTLDIDHETFVAKFNTVPPYN